MVSVPVVRQLEAISSTIEELRERVQVLPDELLSRSEINKFRESLDLIKAEFSEQLKKEINDNEELKQKVDALSKDIDFLKQTLESMTKRKWLEMFGTRLHKWTEKLSLRQITSGTRAITKLPPPEVAATVDGIANTVDEVAGAFEKTPDKANNQISKD
jgi:predicted RNase H-like nuclease (RuvC/YqgF family)